MSASVTRYKNGVLKLIEGESLSAAFSKKVALLKPCAVSALYGAMILSTSSWIAVSASPTALKAPLRLLSRSLKASLMSSANNQVHPLPKPPEPTTDSPADEYGIPEYKGKHTV